MRLADHGRVPEGVVRARADSLATASRRGDRENRQALFLHFLLAVLTLIFNCKVYGVCVAEFLCLY